MNTVKSEYESALKLEKLVFPSINFSRAVDWTNSDELKMRVGRKVELIQTDKLQITLSVKIWAPDHSLDLDLTTFACFGYSFGENVPEDVRSEILEKNTIAIIFPYIRSQVSLVTTQPDMAPVVIPAININELINADVKTSEGSE